MRAPFDALKAGLDWPIAARFPLRPSDHRIALYVIERLRNSDNVARLAAQVDEAHRWHLDERPGQKFELLNQLIRENSPRADEWVVFADDDVLISRGDLRRFVALSAALGFDVSQPGHDRRGFVNYGLTVSRIGTRARETTFVEIGPVFAVSPTARHRVVDTFAGSGMGWGLEQVWYSRGLKFGIVDEVRMQHLGKTGASYDVGGSVRAMHELLQRYGVQGQQPQETLRTWRAWKPCR